MIQVPVLLYPRDVSGRWRKAAASARFELVLFSPFLDVLAQQVLAGAGVTPQACTVVTDLSPDSGAVDYLKQLGTLLKLIQIGVQVKSLDRLHAKVLWVDGAQVIFGSQNFTKFARESHELSATVEQDMSGNEVAAVLQTWVDEADDVTAAQLEALLTALEGVAQVARQRHIKLVEDYQAASKDWERQESNARREALSTLVAGSSLRIQGGPVTARLGVVDSSGGKSLLALHGRSLTDWSRPLERLRYYPILNADSGRLAFARLARSRITYVRYGVNWSTERGADWNGTPVKLRTRFPHERLRRRNITVEMTTHDSAALTCNVELMFNGRSVRCVGIRAGRVGKAHRNGLPDFLDWCLNQWSDPALRHANVARLFREFGYARQHLQTKNADQFFGSEIHSIDVAEVAGIIFLVALPVRS